MTQEKKSNNLVIFGIILVVLFTVGVFMTKNDKAKVVTPAEAKAKTEKFIKDNLLTEGTKFTLSDAKEYNKGLYEFEITIADSKEPFKSYLTKDGKMFVPSAMDIDKITQEKEGAADTATDSSAKDAPAVEAPKSDKPKVEVFVMSYCPYGTQIEKGIIPVAQALKGKIDFKIKFVSYAMHGEKELKENMVQYCIDKEQGDKMLTYVDCFVKSNNGESDKCLAAAKVDKKKVEACVAATDKQFKVMETFKKGEEAWGNQFPPFAIHKADNEKYSVQGSPTLIINGKEISAGRDSASLAKAICGAFNKKPAECDKKFDSASPSAGFGAGTEKAASGSDAAGCGQ